MNFILRRRGLGNTSCNAIKAGSTTGIEIVRNDRPIPQGDIVFRWGCTSNVRAKTIVNEAKAIHTVSDKAGFRALINPKGLCPRTWFAPGNDIQYPVVVRARNHHQGRNLHVANNYGELMTAWRKVGNDGYISALIDKVAEYRVFVVQGRVPCVASKTPADAKAVAWNVAQGGKFDNVRWGDWPLKAIAASVEAFNLSGLDFGGVDVMVDAKGTPYILEINSAPSLTSPYRQACFAKVFDWIVKNGKVAIPLDPKRKGYGKFIHPAISEKD